MLMHVLNISFNNTIIQTFSHYHTLTPMYPDQRPYVIICDKWKEKHWIQFLKQMNYTELLLEILILNFIINRWNFVDKTKDLARYDAMRRPISSNTSAKHTTFKHLLFPSS